MLLGAAEGCPLDLGPTGENDPNLFLEISRDIRRT